MPDSARQRILRSRTGCKAVTISEWSELLQANRPCKSWSPSTTPPAGRTGRSTRTGSATSRLVIGTASRRTQMDASLSWISRGNRLSGRMPSQLGDLSSLGELRLANNDLSGPIPSGLGRLSALTRLDLEKNDLSGPIPSQLGSMSNLGVLLLGDNNLSGQCTRTTGQPG